MMLLSNILIIVILLLALSSFSYAFAEIQQMEFYSFSEHIVTKNATGYHEESNDINSVFLLAGKNDDRYYLSDVVIKVKDLPKSDISKKITIQTAKLKLVPYYADDPSKKYSIVINICVDDYINSISKLQYSVDDPPFTHNFLSTNYCTKISPQDSVLVDSSHIPYEIEFDVTSLTKFLIENGANEIHVVIAGYPLENEITGYDRLPENGIGLLGFVSRISGNIIGDSIRPRLEITYNETASDAVNYFNVIWPISSAIAIPVGGYIIKQRKERLGILNRGSRAILKEIEDIEDALVGRKNYQVIEYQIDGGNERVKYTNAFIDFDAYDSIIQSGELTHFKLETQNVLRNLYTRVKDHDDTIKISNGIEDQYYLKHGEYNAENVSRITRRYEKHLTMLDSEILELVPQAETLLKAESRGFWNRLFHR